MVRLLNILCPASQTSGSWLSVGDSSVPHSQVPWDKRECVPSSRSLRRPQGAPGNTTFRVNSQTPGSRAGLGAGRGLGTFREAVGPGRRGPLGQPQGNSQQGLIHKQRWSIGRIVLCGRTEEEMELVRSSNEMCAPPPTSRLRWQGDSADMCVDVGVSRRPPRGASSPTWFLGPSFAGVSGWDPGTLVLAGVATLSFQTQCCGLWLMTVRDSEPRGDGGLAQGAEPLFTLWGLKFAEWAGWGCTLSPPGLGMAGRCVSLRQSPCSRHSSSWSGAGPGQPRAICVPTCLPPSGPPASGCQDLANKNRDAQLNLDFG